MQVKITLSLAAVLAVALAGCGGSGKPMTKQAFIQQGNEICVNGTKEREAAVAEAAKEGGEELGPEEVLTEAALPATEDMVGELDGLRVPEGDEKQVEAIISGFEEGIEAVEADPKKGLGSAAFKKANEAATAYGLSDCGI